MNTFEAIQQRRAVKTFDPNYKFNNDEINKILSMARHAPTAYNHQNYRFVLIDDENLRKDIQIAANGQKQITDASMLLVLCADTKAWENNHDKYWSNTTEELQQIKSKAMTAFYRNRDLVQRDEGMRSCAFAAQTMMLTAKAMITSQSWFSQPFFTHKAATIKPNSL